MYPFRPGIPAHVAEVIRSLHPDLKRSIKSAVRGIAADPACGEPIQRELDGLQKYRVRRFGIVYAVIRLMAVGNRRHVDEELTERLRRKG